MDIVVKGRNVEVPEHFRVHVAEKLTRSERYDPKIIRVDVELSHETNRRQSKTCQRVQITLASRGPAIRAEASAESFYAALDAAVTKLEARLRRSADRRHDRQHGRTPIAAVATTPDEILADAVPSVAKATTSTAVLDEDIDDAWLASSADAAGGNGSAATVADSDADDDLEDRWAASDDGPGRVVRIKDHPADPITVDQALFQMELVGHDFYLFNDVDTQLPSVVYRRKGFDYGLLRLT
ncbi:ribosome hibernation-promoting factor, HPF/YfiA family [Nakamurella sp. GG22]